MNILIVDDDKNFRDSLALEFVDCGHHVTACESLKELLKDESSIAKFTHAVIDLRLQDESGLDIVASLKQKNSLMKIVMLTGYGSIATAVTAVKNGADDYLAKPVDFVVLHSILEGKKIDQEIAEKEMSLARHEREYIELILEKYNGNISKTAKVLGLHRQSLQRMLRKFTVKE